MKKLRYAMVGGGRDAFIGAVHRKAMALDGEFEFVAGALSSSPDKSRASGRDLGLADDRNHADWQALLADEAKRPKDERIDFVAIVTPNHVHYPVARAFADAGIHVVCDKPLCTNTAEQAATPRLVAQARRRRLRRHVQLLRLPDGEAGAAHGGERRVGEIRKVIVEYNQGWLATQARSSRGRSRPTGAPTPARAGIGGAIGDIGSHAEHLLRYITGLDIYPHLRRPHQLRPRPSLDDDANLLLRLTNGARGILTCSQIDRWRERPAHPHLRQHRPLEWRQEDPNLLHSPIDGPRRVLTRGRLAGEAAPCHAPPVRPSRGVHRGLRQHLPRRGRAHPCAQAGSRRCRFDYPAGRRCPRRALHREDGRVEPQRPQVDADGLRGRPCSSASIWAPRA